MRRAAIVRAVNGRRSKYRAVPTVIDGIRFDSKAEARRWQELKLLERAGEIHGLSRQPRFRLTVPLMRGGNDVGTHELGEYRADFWYLDRQGRLVVEDVKGVRTPLYRWKKKHFEAQYGLPITEIR